MDGRRILPLAALAAFLLLGALRAFFSTIYFSNLSALGIGPTALLALLSLSPALYLLPGWGTRWALLAGALALGVGRVVMGLAWPGGAYLMAASLAVAGGMLLLPALAVDARARHGNGCLLHVAAGLGLGLALDAALTTLADSADPTVARLGLLVTIPGAVALAALAWTPGRDAARAAGAPASARAGTRGRALAAGVALGAFVALEHAALSSPHHLARWNGQGVAPMAAAVVLGLLVPLLLLWRGWRPGPFALAGANAAALAFVLDHTFVHGPLLPLLVFAAQAALVWDVAAVLPWLAEGGLARAGRAFAAGALVALVLHFGLAFALTFAYVPGEAIWKGSERVLLPLAFLLVALPALAAARAGRLPEAVASPGRAGWAALALPVLLLVAAIAVPPAAVTAPGGDAVKVMAFNVHQGFSNAGVVDPEAIARVIREESPDVVLMQESDSPRLTSANVDVVAYVAAKLGYHVAYGPPTSEESFGVGVLSRFPIEEWHAVPLPSREDNRFFVEARLDVRGTDVWVYAVHLGLPAQDRMDQNAVLMERATSRTGPRILGGDWNSCPRIVCAGYEGGGDDVYNRTVEAFVDTRVAVGLPENDEAGLTYEARVLHERIDYVFVSRDVTVMEHAVVKTPAAFAASDHLPVVAVVRVG